MHVKRNSQTTNGPTNGSLSVKRAALLSAVALLLLPTAAIAAPPLTVLTVGGGPNYALNQVAIESNVRYVSSLIPVGVPQTVLFTNGNATDPSVQYVVDGPPLSKEEETFRVLFRQNPSTTLTKYRAPQLPKIAGPSQHAAFGSAMTSLAAPSSGSAASPIMLYFTGHGSPNKDNYENNNYDLWNEKGLTVQELSTEVAKLPQNRPVTLVMVQCFSGSFGNLLFRGGDPNGELLERPLCGFFAATKERVAAGCTPEVNEANYRDFTSFFFAALTGRDRLGGKVAAPDYNKDGKVGMDEAFCYSILTSPSIDVPVATSDVFLRRFVTAGDDVITATSFDHIRDVASPAQRAALDGLSRSLGDETPDRMKNALGVIMASQPRPRQPQTPQPAQSPAVPGAAAVTPPTLPPAQATILRWRKRLEEQFAGLGNGIASPQFAQARESALDYLKANPAVEQEILSARQSLMQGMREGRRTRSASSSSTVAIERASRDVLSLRLARLAKSVVLEEKLRASGDAARIAQFERLKKLEAGNPFLGQ